MVLPDILLWVVLRPLLLPILVITVVITVFVMAVTGRVAQMIAQKRGIKNLKCPSSNIRASTLSHKHLPELVMV